MRRRLWSILLSEILALVGSETLLGRELRDLIAGMSMGESLRLVSGEAASEEAGRGILSVKGDEPALVMNLDSEAVEDADAVLLAGSIESSRRAASLSQGVPVIDLTGALENEPRARLRAPMVEPHDARFEPDAVHCISHPAAVAIALLLTRLNSVRTAVVQIFAPASEFGVAGVEELQEQTVSLLSFKPLPKKTFDAQSAFSLLAELGEDAPHRLDDLEARIDRHLATLLLHHGTASLPSLRVLQAPVFHGYSFSLWVEFEDAGVDEAAIAQALSGDYVEVRESSLDAPTNVGVAGQSGIAVGSIRLDRNHPRAFWIWAVADNIRLMAENAVLVAREVI